MYPELLLPLCALVGALLVGLAFVAVRHSVARRLATREITRRRNELVLAITGACLGTAIIVGALVVGDTLAFSVRQEAYRTLGPIDERILAGTPPAGDEVARKLQQLDGNPDVDGVLSARMTPAAAHVGSGSGAIAEPRVLVWGVDFAAAARFGRAGGDSGLDGPSPPTGQVVINQPLADALRLARGDPATFYLFGQPHRFTVARVVPERGLAGTGLGANVNRNAYLSPLDLSTIADPLGKATQPVTFVSNTGGVQAGADRTDRVVADIRHALGTQSASVLISTPKKDVLHAARVTGDSLGALFLMIGSFSIIAGAMLLVNIFVMLAEERKGQLGMLRAIGMRRSTLISSFGLEGAGYALAATIPGVLLGLGVGWAVAKVAAQIFRSFSATGNGLSIAFAVTPTSIVNGVLLGLAICLITILVTGIRISRFNIIAAIRDLPPVHGARSRRRTLVVTGVTAALFGVASVPAIASSQPETSYLLPSLAALFCVPLLRLVIGSRWAVTAVAGAVLVWSLILPVVRPHLFDSASMAVYVIEGSIVAFSAVALVSENQAVLLRPIRALADRPSETGLATRLAVAYPLATRFRTGATLIMYTIVSLVLVLLVEIAGVIDGGVDRNVADATAGYGIRVDLSPAAAQQTIRELRRGEFAKDVAAVAPLYSASAVATDPGHRTTSPVRTVAVGVSGTSMSAMTFSDRLGSTPTDRSVWTLLARDPHYVVLDQFFGATGGPNGKYYVPGDTFVVTDPRTGRAERKTIAGILANALMFYPVSGDAVNAFPVVGGVAGMRAQFGAGALTSSMLLRLRPGVSPSALAGKLQAHYLSASLVATPIAASVRRMFSANIAFFRLMQGFLALGLLVGITGLGVVMVRAVRERRRTIGVLRALGFHASTVRRSFLFESSVIAVEGVVLGSTLGVLTTWLMYQKSATFDGVRVGFPIEWGQIVVLVAVTLLASLVATLGPARNAARIRPAIAVRVAD